MKKKSFSTCNTNTTASKNQSQTLLKKEKHPRFPTLTQEFAQELKQKIMWTTSTTW